MQKFFRDLQAWQRAMDLAELTYRLTESFPKHELYGLTSQMRRAVVSIPSNISEGSARASRKDFRHFILIAKGGTCELRTQLLLAVRFGYLSEENYRQAELLSEHVARLLSGLASSLKPPPTPTT